MSEHEIVAPSGEIDFSTVADFRAAIAKAGQAESHGLVIDLTGVSFIDSSVLGAMLEARDRTQRAGRDFAVVAPHGSAPAVAIGLAGLRGVLPVYDTRADVE